MKTLDQKSFQLKADADLPISEERSIEQQEAKLLDRAKRLGASLRLFDGQALRRWKSEISSVVRAKTRQEVDQGAREALRHVSETLEQEKQKAEMQLAALVKKYPRAPAVLSVMAALGMHAPIVRNVEPFKTGIDLIMHPEWAGYDAVYQPQSEEARKAAEKKAKEWEARKDEKGLESFSQSVEARLQHGEHVRLRDMVFELERLSGVPADEVSSAEQKADELIARYAEKAKAKGGIDQAFLNELTGEMYGGQTVYDWGQGSVTEFLNRGVRSCNPVDIVQEMVLEGSIEVLPVEEQKNYRFGSNVIEQHVRTTVTITFENISQTFLLDGQAILLAASEGPAPSMSAPMDSEMVKRSLVTSKPLRIQAISARSGEAKPKKSLIEVKINSPLKRNIQVEGDLRPSEFVEAQLKKEGVQAIYLSEETKKKIEAFKDTATKEQIIELEIFDEKAEVEKITKELKDAQDAVAVGASDVMAKLSPIHGKKAIEVLNNVTQEGLNTRFGFELGDTYQWSEEALEAALSHPQRDIQLSPNAKGEYDPRIIKIWKQNEQRQEWVAGNMRIAKLKLRANNSFTPDGRSLVTPPTGQQFNELMENLPSNFAEIDVNEDYGLDPRKLAEGLLKIKGPKKISIWEKQFRNIPSPLVDACIKQGHTFNFSLDEYVELVQDGLVKPGMAMDDGDLYSRDLGSVLIPAAHTLALKDSPDNKKIREKILSALERHAQENASVRNAALAFVQDLGRIEPDGGLKMRWQALFARLKANQL